MGLGVASPRICFQILRPVPRAWGTLVYALRGDGLLTRYPSANNPIYYWITDHQHGENGIICGIIAQHPAAISTI